MEMWFNHADYTADGNLFRSKKDGNYQYPTTDIKFLGSAGKIEIRTQ